MDYFTDCETLNNAREQYFKLAKIVHPDVGGNTEKMQNLNEQFAAFRPSFLRYDNELSDWDSADYATIIDQLLRIKGIEIIVCGSWVWLKGDTLPVKDEIKAVKSETYKSGFSRNKKQWYFSPKSYRKRSKKKYSFSQIQGMWGSKTVSSRKDEDRKKIA